MNGFVFHLSQDPQETVSLPLPKHGPARDGYKHRIQCDMCVYIYIYASMYIYIYIWICLCVYCSSHISTSKYDPCKSPRQGSLNDSPGASSAELFVDPLSGPTSRFEGSRGHGPLFIEAQGDTNLWPSMGPGYPKIDGFWG